jgi:hypothetical protein
MQQELIDKSSTDDWHQRPEHVPLRFISKSQTQHSIRILQTHCKNPSKPHPAVGLLVHYSTPTSSLACRHHGLQAASSSSIWSKCHTPALHTNNVSSRDKHRQQNNAAVSSKTLTVAFADSSQLRDVLRDLLDGINLST